jgi:hypothetical protein
MTYKAKASEIYAEIVMPSRIVSAFGKSSDSDKNIDLRVRINNNSERAYQFLLFHVQPTLYKVDGGKISRFGPNCNRFRRPEQSDFSWIDSGKYIDFQLAAKFSWFNNILIFVFTESNGANWVFSPIKWGKNCIQLTYSNPLPVWEVYDGRTLEARFEDVWVGSLTTQLVDFTIARSVE